MRVAPQVKLTEKEKSLADLGKQARQYLDILQNVQTPGWGGGQKLTNAYPWGTVLWP